jgi:hypothetical protein
LGADFCPSILTNHISMGNSRTGQWQINNRLKLTGFAGKLAGEQRHGWAEKIAVILLRQKDYQLTR